MDRDDGWSNADDTCSEPGCGRRVEQMGRCHACNRGMLPEPIDRERVRQAVRQGHANTALMLRRMGYTHEAEWHERRAAL